MPLSEQAQEIARSAGLLSARGTVDRPRTTGGLIDIYRSNHNVEIAVELMTKAATFDRLTVEVFGASDDLGELRQVVAQLSGIDASRPVQKTLNGNGMTLCADRLNMKFTENGAEISRSVPVRFVSAAPDILTAHYIRNIREQMLKAVGRGVASLDLVIQRVPALMPQRNQLLLDLGGELSGMVANNG